MASIRSPRERLALIERLAARPGADSESFFVAYGLGEAYRGPGRSSSKKTKINAALQAAADDGRTNEILDAVAKYVGEPEVDAEESSHSPMPAPTNEAQAQLLQAVWDLLPRRRSQWPTLQEVDYKLDREHELDVVSIAASLPDDLLMPPRLESLDPSQELKLTVAGVRACQGSEDDLKIFLDALRVAVQIEREFVPEKDSKWPTLSAADLAERSRLPAANLPAKLARLGCLLAAEHWGWVSVARGDPGHANWRINFDRRIRRLRNVTNLDDYWRITREGRSPSQPATEAVVPTELDTIFLVHGHDDARYEVARYLEKVVQDTEVVILSEQANRGMTVIEKFEAHGSAASFAVVLLTPDDEGRAVGAAELQPRARQNVVFELGYFVGKLGRDRVVVLNKGGVEKPSDIAGVVYIDFPQSNWKDDLDKELRAAGFTVL